MNRSIAGRHAKPDPKRFCAIVFIGLGSSWMWGADPGTAAKKAAKFAKEDWGRLYKFERKQEFAVHVYDMADHDGWHAAGGVVRDSKTNEPIEIHSVHHVTV